MAHLCQGPPEWRVPPPTKPPLEEPQGWHLLSWLSCTSCRYSVCCEANLGQGKGDAPTGYTEEPAARKTSSRMRCDVGLPVEACCSKTSAGQDSREEEADPKDQVQVWDMRSKVSAKEEAAEQRSDQEPDPEHMSTHAEEQKAPTSVAHIAEVRKPLSPEEFAEMRQLLIKLTFDHSPDKCAEEEVAPWVDQMLQKYPGLERELYTRLCGKYGEQPVGKYDARDDSYGRRECSVPEEREARSLKPADGTNKTSRSGSNLSGPNLQAILRQGSSKLSTALGQAKQQLR